MLWKFLCIILIFYLHLYSIKIHTQILPIKNDNRLLKNRCQNHSRTNFSKGVGFLLPQIQNKMGWVMCQIKMKLQAGKRQNEIAAIYITRKVIIIPYKQKKKSLPRRRLFLFNSGALGRGVEVVLLLVLAQYNHTHRSQHLQ